MKIKQTLLSGLLLASAALIAGEPVIVQEPTNSEFLRSSSQMFSRKQADRNYLKIVRNTSSARERDWDESEVTKGGLFLNLGLMFPAVNYLNPYYTGGDPKYGLGFNFEIGSVFRLVKLSDGRMAISLRAKWLGLNYAKLVDDKDVYRAAQIMPVHIGPQFSYALNEMMGIDAYYTIGYNLTEEFGAIDDPANKKDVGLSITYMGVSHEVGAALRYKIFSLGLGYGFGKLKMTNYVYDGKDYTEFIADDEKKVSINNLKLTLGFRF